VGVGVGVGVSQRHALKTLSRVFVVNIESGAYDTVCIVIIYNINILHIRPSSFAGYYTTLFRSRDG